MNRTQAARQMRGARLCSILQAASVHCLVSRHATLGSSATQNDRCSMSYGDAGLTDRSNHSFTQAK